MTDRRLGRSAASALAFAALLLASCGPSSRGAGSGAAGTGSGAAGAAGGGGNTGAAGRGESGGSTGGATAGTGGGAGTTSACAPPTITLSGADAVAGIKITFNDNGAWNWFQDERVLVDTRANKLLVGSVASGGARNGNIEAVVYDIAAGTKELYTVSTSLSAYVDDHNAPAFVIRPDGRYVAQYCGHRVDCITRFSIFNGSSWSTEQKFDWAPDGCPWTGASTNMVTYSNPWYIGSSIYSAVRSVSTNPALLTSADDGQSWSYYGRLMSSARSSDLGGYFKYWGNNTDRVDFVGTEGHPRDVDNSLYHGYIQGGKVYDSTGTVMDPALMDTSASVSNSVAVTMYTPVFKTGSSLNGTRLCRLWNHDIVRYADGTIAVLAQARADNCTSTPSLGDPDKRLVYFRFDGTSWKGTYLVKAGPKLIPEEEDYVGLGALVPDDPTTIYVSTPYDPTTDAMASGGKREIWRGTTCDGGASFEWTPVTANSTKDNIRPVVPRWDSNHTALLWMQGIYPAAQLFTTAIVGVLTTKP